MNHIDINGNQVIVDGMTLTMAPGSTMTVNAITLRCDESGQVCVADDQTPVELPGVARNFFGGEGK